MNAWIRIWEGTMGGCGVWEIWACDLAVYIAG